MPLPPRQHQKFARIHDGAESHRDGLVGLRFYLAKKTCVIGQCFRGQYLNARARSERGARFVERQVSIGTDTKNLQVDASGLLDAPFVPGASGVEIGSHPVRYMNPVGVDAYVIEKMLPHEIPVALRVFGRQTHVLVRD